MQNIFLKFSIGISIALSASSCTTLDNFNDNRTADKIRNDAVRLNEAFNQSTNAVILKNILRARDRWPVNFTTLSGIRSNPTRMYTGKTTLTPLGLGNPAGPLQGTSAELTSVQGSDNEYSVNPFASGENSHSLLNRTPNKVFKRYYDAWPKDVVFLLFVGSLEYEKGDKKITIMNSGDNYAKFKSELETAFGIVNINLKEDIILTSTTPETVKCGSEIMSIDRVLHKLGNLDNLDKFKAVTGGVIKIESRLEGGTNKDVKLSICPPKKQAKKVFVLSKKPAGKNEDKTLELTYKLRSFEDIIYYLGEALRVPKGDIPNARIKCLKQSRNIPLFDAIPHSKTQGTRYGAQVIHAGGTFYVMPKGSSIKCPADRTSTVMSILNQLLLLNQSPEFLKAPDSVFR